MENLEEISIKDMLLSLKSNNKSIHLANTRDTWKRIGNRDPFSELGLSGTCLDDFLNEWMSNNSYENIA